MGRPQRPIPDDDRSPEAEFARGLRRLRADAGNPTYAQLQRRTGYSDTTLSAAMSGRGRPSLEVVQALVAALGGDPAEWEARWQSLPAPGPADTRTTPAEPAPAEAAAPPRRRGLLATAGAMLALVAVGAAVAGFQLADRSEREPAATTAPTASESVTVTVQNQVTAGPAAMREDTPAYLSTRAENGCRLRGCDVPEPTFDTGDHLDVVCQVTGERTTNGNDGDPADDGNPELFTSTRWYGSPLPGGDIGYISETWLSPADRGGLDLPRCE